VSTVQGWRMDRRITILVPDEAPARGSAGSAIPGYSALAEVWAERRDLSGRDVIAAAQTIATAQCRYRIRWLDGFDTRARVQEGDTVYEIQHIAELGRREGQEILASLPGPAPDLEAD
jgi:SPP1 family predicted phage head-tail adaptor